MSSNRRCEICNRITKHEIKLKEDNERIQIFICSRCKTGSEFFIIRPGLGLPKILKDSLSPEIRDSL